jgi:hypothetical protein
VLRRVKAALARLAAYRPSVDSSKQIR